MCEYLGTLCFLSSSLLMSMLLLPLKSLSSWLSKNLTFVISIEGVRKKVYLHNKLTNHWSNSYSKVPGCGKWSSKYWNSLQFSLVSFLLKILQKVKELDYQSYLLCTFSTPLSRYRFKRLPFKNDPVTRYKCDEAYKGISNLTSMADNTVCGWHWLKPFTSVTLSWILKSFNAVNYLYLSMAMHWEGKIVNQ